MRKLGKIIAPTVGNGQIDLTGKHKTKLIGIGLKRIHLQDRECGGRYDN